MNFDTLVALIIEGEGTIGFDLNPSELSKEDLRQLTKKSDKQLSLDDNDKREFELKWDGEVYKTSAKTSRRALMNIAYQIAKRNNLKPSVMVSKFKRERPKIKDVKWNVTY